jgi:amino acid adenylation domain-containing protein/non-ribosomal peptide synthase protein (TIGR01720 family)
VQDARASENDLNLAEFAGAGNLAYVMYTSGSTGEPKGVEITHRAVIRTVVSTDYVSLGPSEVIAQLANVCFDAATFEIWGPLLNGGRIAGIDRSIALSPEDFAHSLSEQKVSTIFVTTDLFNQLVKTRPDTFSSVENLLVGGTAINPKWIDACLHSGPPRRLLHVYGPTESTTFASWHLIEDVSKGATSIPIGLPLANTEIYVLDRNLSQVPAGVTGEIYVGGDGLARGYHNRPELTAEKFIPNPFARQQGSRLYRTGDRARRDADGALEFLGRVDDQVKIRGFRVEPGEVETIIKGHSGVSEAVVLARHDVPGTTSLVAYVVSNNGNLLADDLRRYLSEQLPEYMRPSAYVFFDEMPLTPNGKADRSALTARTERYSPEKPQAEPRTPAEKTLVEIWRDVLAHPSVGIHDNFFELGGDSIISIQIISRAREAGLNLTLRQLFENRTIAELAAVARNEVASQAEAGILEGELPLMPVQHWFFEHESGNPHHFNQSSLIQVPAGMSAVWLRQATEQLLLQHDSLRLRFRKDAGQWRQWYAAPGIVPFQVIKSDGVAPADRTSWLEREIANLQESLNLEHGPVASITWFDFGAEPGRVLFLIHHLVVDTVSWRILMEDFWRAYNSLAKEKVISLPAKTSSLRQWATRLVLHAQSAQVHEELPYWSAAVNGFAPVPKDFFGNDNLVATADSVNVELSAQETRELLHETPKAYQTQINDVLLTALAQTLSEWTGQRTVTFDLEGHGREPLFEELDVTRTVGWFTTIFPVRLEITTEHLGDALKSVKEQLRRVPNRGLTFGLLRYLNRASSDVGSLRGPSPDVAFNYLGQLDEVQELESTGPDRSQLTPRRHLIEINARVSGRQLRVDWEFSEVNHRRGTIERLAKEFIDHLSNLIAHCRSSKQTHFTPSDFAHAGISQNELDKLVAIVDGPERPAR